MWVEDLGGKERQYIVQDKIREVVPSSSAQGQMGKKAAPVTVMRPPFR